MREYKFRAWYTPGAIMIYPEWDSQAGAFIFDIPRDGQILLSKALRRRDFKPMLAVGIQDKHKRDIYERDIVRRWEGDTEIPRTVVEHTPQFWWDNIKTTTYEVIGNTFENGDLIAG